MKAIFKNETFECDDDEIIRLSYDEYGKWVPLADGEKVIWTEER